MKSSLVRVVLLEFKEKFINNGRIWLVPGQLGFSTKEVSIKIRKSTCRNISWIHLTFKLLLLFHSSKWALQSHWLPSFPMLSSPPWRPDPNSISICTWQGVRCCFFDLSALWSIFMQLLLQEFWQSLLMLDFQSVLDKIIHIKSSQLVVILSFHQQLQSPSLQKCNANDLEMQVALLQRCQKYSW